MIRSGLYSKSLATVGLLLSAIVSSSAQTAPTFRTGNPILDSVRLRVQINESLFPATTYSVSDLSVTRAGGSLRVTSTRGPGQATQYSKQYEVYVVLPFEYDGGLEATSDFRRFSTPIEAVPRKGLLAMVEDLRLLEQAFRGGRQSAGKNWDAVAALVQKTHQEAEQYFGGGSKFQMQPFADVALKRISVPPTGNQVNRGVSGIQTERKSGGASLSSRMRDLLEMNVTQVRGLLDSTSPTAHERWQALSQSITEARKALEASARPGVLWAKTLTDSSAKSVTYRLKYGTSVTQEFVTPGDETQQKK